MLLGITIVFAAGCTAPGQPVRLDTEPLAVSSSVHRVHTFAAAQLPATSTLLVGPELVTDKAQLSEQRTVPMKRELRVRVLAKGVPVSAAHVTLHDGSGPNGRTAVSDAQGELVFELAQGMYQVSARAPSLVSTMAVVVSQPGVQELTLVLHPAGSGKGRVVDGAGNPIAAKVVLVSEQDLSASQVHHTNADGTFRIEGLAFGTWQVAIDAMDYVAVGSALLKVGPRPIDLQLRVEKGGIAQGQVFDAQGSPVVGAKLVLRGEQGNSISQGRRQGSTRWLHPLAGPRQMPIRSTRRFGAARAGHRPAECGRGHCGVDLGTKAGVVVHATAMGTLTRVVRDGKGAAGDYVAIEHPGGLTSFYMHLGEIRADLRVGQRVPAGQAVGRVGRTGVVHSGPHLHYAISQGQGAVRWFVDPEPILQHASLLAIEGSMDSISRIPDALGEQVLAHKAELAFNQTDATGRFQIRGLAAGRYTLLVHHEDFAMGKVRSLQVRQGQESKNIEVRLTAGAQVHGTVYGADSVLAGATIVVEQGQGLGTQNVAQTTTDEAGRFLLKHLSGLLRIRISHKGYGDVEQVLDLQEASKQGLKLRLASLDRSLGGQLLDPDGFALRFASVRIVKGASGRGRETKTDVYGAFQLLGLSAGSYDVDIRADGFPALLQTMHTREVQEIVVPFGGRVRLQIDDGHTGAALQGVVVEAQGPKKRRAHSTSSERGIVVFPALDTGTWSVQVQVPGYVPFRQEILVSSEQDELTPVKLYRGATLAGVLRDSEGERVAGGKVWLGAMATHTDSHGRFRLEQVATGKVSLEASRRGKRASLPLHLSPGDEFVTLEPQLRELEADSEIE